MLYHVFGNGKIYEKERSSSGDSSWYSSWSDVCHKQTSVPWRGLMPSEGESWPSSTEAAFGSSSFHLSIERRRAFMKKLPTVVGSKPSCRAIVTCISFDGLLVSWENKKSIRICTYRCIFILYLKFNGRYYALVLIFRYSIYYAPPNLIHNLKITVS